MFGGIFGWKKTSFFILSLVISWNVMTGVGGNNSQSGSSSEHEAMKEWFEAQFGLKSEPNQNVDTSGTQSNNRAARAHTPQYVQNLYDRMATEVDDEGQQQQQSPLMSNRRQRRNVINGASYNFGTGENAADINDEPMTIQAVTRDPNGPMVNGSGVGYKLRFNFDQLWISEQQLQLAELVLAVDHGRLSAPRRSYSIYVYAIDESQSKLLVSAGSLGVLDTFRDSFLKLKVTDTVVRKVLSGERSIQFEVFVEVGGQGDSARRDLRAHEIGHLLHLTSTGAHQPLLVLYSETAKRMREVSSTSRRRRNLQMPPQSPVGAPASSSNNNNHDDECGRHEWWVDLVAMFQEKVIAPDGFYAYYCAGSCPARMLHSRWNATGNAHLRCAYCFDRKFKNEACDVPKPSCVPQSLSPITVAYNVGTHFVLRRLESMVADSCMCA